LSSQQDSAFHHLGKIFFNLTSTTHGIVFTSSADLIVPVSSHSL